MAIPLCIRRPNARSDATGWSGPAWAHFKRSQRRAVGADQLRVRRDLDRPAHLLAQQLRHGLILRDATREEQGRGCPNAADHGHQPAHQ